VYVDASALVKLVIDEPETAALKDFLRDQESTLTTSAIAVVEVSRASAIADPSIETQAKARRFLDACHLIGVGETILRGAAQAAPRFLRTLDAIHLVTAQFAAPDKMIVYDKRLEAAAREVGLAVVSPGA
jgi:predicted nucleic acid-binding protein